MEIRLQGRNVLITAAVVLITLVIFMFRFDTSRAFSADTEKQFFENEIHSDTWPCFRIGYGLGDRIVQNTEILLSLDEQIYSPDIVASVWE